MTVLLVGVAVYTILGGMLSVLVTDFLQFVVMSVGLLVVSFLVLGRRRLGPPGRQPCRARWATAASIRSSTRILAGPFVLSNVFTNTAAVLTWQTCIARLLAAKDSKTGRKVYTGTAFFFICRWVIPGLWGIAALAMIEPTVVAEIGEQFGEKDGTLFAMPYLSGTDRARGHDGCARGGHAGGRHVHRFVVHADLGQRDLQRHPCAVPPHALVGEERASSGTAASSR